MKRIIQIALLMVAMVFLCGTQGYAVKLNSKGQKMVSRLILHKFQTGEIYGEVVFTYDEQNNLKSVRSICDRGEIIIQKGTRAISVKRYESGKLVTDHQLTVILDNNGNISETQDDCIKTDGGRVRKGTFYTYNFCTDLNDYVIYYADCWSLAVTPKGEIHPVTKVNGRYVKEHSISLKTYKDGNAQTQCYCYNDDKLLESFSGYYEQFYNNDVDDTNINMATLFGGFSCGDPMAILMMTEWAKRKTKNLIVGVDNGMGEIVQQAEYLRDIDGNLVTMTQQLGRTGFFMDVEYVD